MLVVLLESHPWGEIMRIYQHLTVVLPFVLRKIAATPYADKEALCKAAEAVAIEGAACMSDVYDLLWASSKASQRDTTDLFRYALDVCYYYDKVVYNESSIDALLDIEASNAIGRAAFDALCDSVTAAEDKKLIEFVKTHT